MGDLNFKLTFMNLEAFILIGLNLMTFLEVSKESQSLDFFHSINRILEIVALKIFVFEKY